MSTSMKIALYGDSYISRLGKFCNDDLKVPGDVRFFGRGGMMVHKQDPAVLGRLQRFQPDIVVINLGGNDINSQSKPMDIVDEIEAMVNSLIVDGAKTVYFGEICERGNFKKDPELTKKSFNAQRRKINTILRRNNNINIVDIHKEIRFPKDYDMDLVHFNEQGLNKYFYLIRRVLCSHRG